jgi:hypothetical protein
MSGRQQSFMPRVCEKSTGRHVFRLYLAYAIVRLHQIRPLKAVLILFSRIAAGSEDSNNGKIPAKVLASSCTAHKVRWAQNMQLCSHAELIRAFSQPPPTRPQKRTRKVKVPDGYAGVTGSPQVFRHHRLCVPQTIWFFHDIPSIRIYASKNNSTLSGELLQNKNASVDAPCYSLGRSASGASCCNRLTARVPTSAPQLSQSPDRAYSERMAAFGS